MPSQMQRSPITQRELIVFTALIAAPSTGNLRTKVLHNVLHQKSSCVNQRLAKTMEDVITLHVYTLWTDVCVWILEILLRCRWESSNSSLANKQQWISFDCNDQNFGRLLRSCRWLVDFF